MRRRHRSSRQLAPLISIAGRARQRVARLKRSHLPGNLSSMASGAHASRLQSPAALTEADHNTGANLLELDARAAETDSSVMKEGQVMTAASPLAPYSSRSYRQFPSRSAKRAASSVSSALTANVHRVG